LFLITAAYAVAFDGFSYLGIWGIIIATFIGTTGSLLILSIRDRKDFITAAVFASGSLIGVFFAFFFTPYQMHDYTIWNFLGVFFIWSAGAIIGGISLSLIWKYESKNDKRD
jgi:hypothetical protein